MNGRKNLKMMLYALIFVAMLMGSSTVSYADAGNGVGEVKWSTPRVISNETLNVSNPWLLGGNNVLHLFFENENYTLYYQKSNSQGKEWEKERWITTDDFFPEPATSTGIKILQPMFVDKHGNIWTVVVSHDVKPLYAYISSFSDFNFAWWKKIGSSTAVIGGYSDRMYIIVQQCSAWPVDPWNNTFLIYNTTRHSSIKNPFNLSIDLGNSAITGDGEEVFLLRKDYEDNLYFMRTGNYGKTWSNDILISNFSCDSQSLQLYLSKENLYAIWADNGRIYLKIGYSYGERWSDNIPLNSGLEGYAKNPRAAPDSEGNIWLVWENHGNDSGIFWEKISHEGRIIAGPEMFNGSENGKTPWIAMDDQDTAHVVWEKEGKIYYIRSTPFPPEISGLKNISGERGSEFTVKAHVSRGDYPIDSTLLFVNISGTWKSFEMLSNGTEYDVKISIDSVGNFSYYVVSRDIYGTESKSDEFWINVKDTIPPEIISMEERNGSMLVIFSEPVDKNSVEIETDLNYSLDWETPTKMLIIPEKKESGTYAITITEYTDMYGNRGNPQTEYLNISGSSEISQINSSNTGSQYILPTLIALTLALIAIGYIYKRHKK